MELPGYRGDKDIGVPSLERPSPGDRGDSSDIPTDEVSRPSFGADVGLTMKYEDEREGAGIGEVDRTVGRGVPLEGELRR